MTTHASPVPPDDFNRKRSLAHPDDQTLPDVAVAGGKYPILLTGKETAGRYRLLDMLFPPGGGRPPQRHDFEETFTA